MDKPSFVYVTYIASTPEKVWEALTKPEFTSQYWFGGHIDSDWREGSPMTLWKDAAHKEIDLRGKVLKFDPPRTLSYTFEPMQMPEADRGLPSRVTFQLETVGNTVKLTLVHDEFSPGSEKVIEGVSNGWPMLLCGIKSILETGNRLTIGKVCGRTQ